MFRYENGRKHVISGNEINRTIIFIYLQNKINLTPKIAGKE